MLPAATVTSTRTLLDRLVQLKETPTPVTLLLTDTVEVCGRGLLYSLVCAHLRAGTKVLYITTCLYPSHIWQFTKDDDTPGKIEFYSGASDPCGWNSGVPAMCLREYLPEVLTVEHETCSKVAVVVDRVEHLAYHQDPVQIVRGLHALSAESKVEQVVMYCGRDVVSESLLLALTHLAAGVMHMEATRPCSCALTLRKPSGKVVKAREEFTLTPDLKVQKVRPVQKSTGNQGTAESSTSSSSSSTATSAASSDPCTDALLASQTTFSLTLTDDQRRAKNELLLPHTRVQGESGQILYTPDREDDWDEDDPDDDLDI